MAIFNSFLYVYQRVTLAEWLDPQEVPPRTDGPRPVVWLGRMARWLAGRLERWMAGWLEGQGCWISHIQWLVNGWPWPVIMAIMANAEVNAKRNYPGTTAWIFWSNFFEGISDRVVWKSNVYILKSMPNIDSKYFWKWFGRNIFTFYHWYDIPTING